MPHRVVVMLCCLAVSAGVGFGALALARAAGPSGAVRRVVIASAGGASAPRPAGAPALPGWALLPDMPTPRGLLAAVSGPGPGGDLLYAIGGSYDGGETPLPSLEAYSPVTHGWTVLADMPTARLALAAAAGADGRIYAIGGCYGGCGRYYAPLAVVEAYTPAANTWSIAASLPVTSTDLAAVAAPNGRIYALGGWDHQALAAVQAYTPAANTWTLVARLPTARSDLAAALGADGRVYAIGGATNGGRWLTTVEAYTPRTNTWTVVAPLPAAGAYPTAAAAPDGRIYVVLNAPAVGPNAVWAYTPAANTWTAVVTTLRPRNFGAAATGPDGRVYLAGGCCFHNGSEFDDLVQAYGPHVTLTPPSGLPGAAASLSGGNFAARAAVRVYWGTAVTGTVLVSGTTDAQGRLPHALAFHVPAGAVPGRTYPVTAVDSASGYPVSAPFLVLAPTPTPTVTSTPTATTSITPSPTDTAAPPPARLRWTAAPSLAYPCDRFVAAVEGRDGRVYAMGCDEAYRPGDTMWTAIARMPTDRLAPAAATGLDGRIYVFGGQMSAGWVVSVTEAYTPATNTWTTLAPMPTARRDAAAVTGPDGRIYVMGGDSGWCGLCPEAEVYTPATNTWATLAPEPIAQAGGSGILGPDGRIYVVGSDGAYTGSQTTAQLVQTYSVQTNTWTERANLPTANANNDPAASLGADGRIYVVGGYSGASCNPCAAVAGYTFGSNTWQASTPMITPRGMLGAATGADGRVYAIGGLNAGTTVEAYGPIMALSPTFGARGGTVVLTGTNFAANATVRVYWGTPATGTLLGTVATGAGGALTRPLRFTVPKGIALGAYQVTAVDNRSRYPTYAGYVVTSTPPALAGFREGRN